MFQKQQSVGVLQNRCSSNFCEMLRKAQMPKSLFKKVVDLLAWNFKLKTASRIFLKFFNEFCKNVKSTFLQDSSRRLLLIFRKPDIQTFDAKQICSHDQYCRDANLMSRNVNFRTSILQLSYYKNNFQPEKLSLDICQYMNF